MTKYLAIAPSFFENFVSYCFYDDEIDKYDFFSSPANSDLRFQSDFLDEKINNYQVSKLISYPHNWKELSRFLDKSHDIFMLPKSPWKLHKEIKTCRQKLDGLEVKKNTWWVFQDLVIKKKFFKIAFLIVFIYLGKIELKEVSLEEEEVDVQEKEELIKLSFEQIKKLVINMSPDLQELIRKISEVSKLSVVASLSSAEIRIFINKVDNFKSVLETVYPIKKREEVENDGNNQEMKTNNETQNEY